MNTKQKKLLFRIIASVALLIAAYVIRALTSPSGVITLLLFLVPYFIAGYDVLFSAARNILHGQIFDENFLMCIATVGAICIKEYPEAVFVMTFFQAGELFQNIAVGKSRASISELMNIRPETATVIRDGKCVTVSPEEVEIGETLWVLAGEKIPIDGTVTEGISSLDTSALTGEALPREVSVGDNVSGGCINLNSPIKLQTVTDYDNSTVARILELVENAASSKAKTERFITRFAHYYTPAVVIGALLLALIPGIITQNFAEWLHRALIFLVISCPCALVISVPLSFFGGIGAAGKNGILVKGSNYLEALANIDTAVFDKTGTLTRGDFSVVDAKVADNAKFENDTDSLEQLYLIAASVEINSDHPIARSVVTADKEKYGDRPLLKMSSVTEHAGMGISAVFNGARFMVGNRSMMTENGITPPPISEGATALFIAKDSELLGHILISDRLKPTSKAAIKELRNSNVRRTVMLTGDRQEAAAPIAEELGIDELHAGLMPEDKVNIVDALCKQLPKNKKLAFVGDGINDAPVLTRADIGIAMGALGSDAAIESADVVLMDDDPLKLAYAMQISVKTRRIVIENIVFALGVKAIFLIMGAFGVANLWEAVFADVGVAVIAILNAMRTLKLK